MDGRTAARRFQVVEGGGVRRAGGSPPLPPRLAAEEGGPPPFALRIEGWSWTGEEDVFVLRGWSPESGETLRFAAPLTEAVRAAVARGLPIPFRLLARAERLARLPAPGAEDARGSPEAGRWADGALAGDPFARAMLRRTAERMAAVAERGGPARMMVRLGAVGGGEGGAYPEAAYLLRGAASGLGGPPSLGPGGTARRGTLDAGRLRLALEVPAALSGPIPDGALLECEASLTGAPA